MGWTGGAAGPEGPSAVVGRVHQVCLCKTGGGGGQVTDGLRGRRQAGSAASGGMWGGSEAGKQCR